MRRVGLLASAAALVALAACSSPLSSGPATTTTAPPTTTTIPGSQTPALTKASTYRAQLTYLMVEQVYLLERATAQAVRRAAATTPSGTSPGGTSSAPTAATTTTAAAPGGSTSTTTPVTSPPPLPALATSGVDGDASAALDRNSHDLADTVAQAAGYGSPFDSEFYDLWTARIEHFLAYARAAASKDASGTSAATSALTGDDTAIATLIHDANKYVAVTTLGGTGMADELAPIDRSVTTFVGDQVAHTTSLAGDVVKAAETMYHTADYLASAAAKLDGSQYPGTADGTAANLRSSFTMAWVEHVQLTAIDLGLFATGGDDRPWAAAVADNTTELRNAVAVNLGDQTARQFMAQWGSYIGALRDFARATAAGDADRASAASGELAAVPADIGSLLHSHLPALGSDQVAGDLSPLVTGLQRTAAVAAVGSPTVTLTRGADGYVPGLAADVSEAFATANRNLYAP